MFIPIAELLLVFGLLRQYFLASGTQVVPPELIYLCHLQTLLRKFIWTGNLLIVILKQKIKGIFLERFRLN